MMYRIFLLSLCLPICAFAQEAPRPSHHPSREIERQRQESETRKLELEKVAKNVSKEMDATRNALVAIAKDIKQNEARLGELDAKITA